MLRIEVDDLSRRQVLALLEEHLRNMYELSPPDQVFAFDASKLKAPGVSFWTAWNDEHLLGCAALKELSPTEGEIKSMRTPSASRRKGVGRALLNHIIDVARSRDYRALYLETGIHPAFLPAQTLYRSAGFKLCGPFASYRENGNSVFMSLTLSNGLAADIATAADRQAIRALLTEARLPVADLDAAPQPTFWVARDDSGRPVGAVGLERHGDAALLRSLVVTPSRRLHGVGRMLVQTVEQHAQTTGITQLVLLTETAEAFFRRLDYAVIDRNRAPPAVASSAEFLTLCPSTAVCLTKRLSLARQH